MEDAEVEVDRILDKKKEKSLYLKRLQIKLKNSIESGMLKPEEQYMMIESTIDEMLSNHFITEDVADKFYNRQDHYMKQLEELQIKISEFYKINYENLLEL